MRPLSKKQFMIKLFSERITELEKLSVTMQKKPNLNQFPASVLSATRRVDFVNTLIELNNQLLVKAHCMVEPKKDYFERRTYQ